MSCKNVCQLCNKLVISQAVTVVTVDGTDTLVIDLPIRNYGDGCKYCIIVAQTIPATATINQPVAFSIGGDTTTVFPFTTKCCDQVVACQIRTRTKYSTCVNTSATGGVFRAIGNLPCCPSNNLLSLPIPAPTTATVLNTMAFKSTDIQTKSAKATTTNKKEMTSNE